ncbi:glycosyltransferase [Fictibacillus sp. Mic-4]|uniref:glycosyltransferase n=1 Tax=Fictibacillus sp. Mic-4 TaxID=3132826 RepID=UPI003CEF04F2
MPTSWYQAVSQLIDLVVQDNPQSILDVGVGFGKYGVLLREALDIPHERYSKEQWQVKIDGVEGFSGYQNPIHSYVYNQMYYGNIVNLIDQLGKYDTILLIDVLEHFQKDEGLRLIASLLEHANKSLIISTPIYPGEQKEYIGNQLEEHKSRWSIVDLVEFDCSYQKLDIGDNGAHVFKLYPNKKRSPETLYHRTLTADANMKLTIGYLLPHHNLTGGLKMLLQQMKWLRKSGHRIYAFYKGTGEKALPSWFELEVDKEIVVPPNDSFVHYIKECDIAMAGWMSQLPELKSSPVPIVYWEQGYEWLFGDIPESMNVSAIRKYLKECYDTSIPIISVSSTVSKLLKSRFLIDAPVITNGIDVDLYHPSKKKKSSKMTILLVGNPGLSFKGFDVALMALNNLWTAGHLFSVDWICQYQPDLHAPFPLNFIVQPDQKNLADIYRTADIFIFTSWYEGFGMPPLEAMASGVPVISTKCGGVEEYARSGQNSILVEPGDVPALTWALSYLIDHPEVRNELAEAGRNTALQYSYGNVIKELEDYLLTSIRR